MKQVVKGKITKGKGGKGKKSDMGLSKKLDKRMEKPPKESKVKLEGKTDKTHYTKDEFKANRPHKMPNMVKRDKKVGKTKYD